MSQMKGFFGIGVEGINKPRNLGNLLRSAHSFGASYFYTVAKTVADEDMNFADTARSSQEIPMYHYNNIRHMVDHMPKGAQLVGVELVENSVDLPSFCHPRAASYILGPEQGSLSDETLELCDHVIKIPMKFCINVGVAGALVMYDRLMNLGQFPARPVVPGGDVIPLPEHQRGHRYISRAEKKSK